MRESVTADLTPRIREHNSFIEQKQRNKQALTQTKGEKVSSLKSIVTDMASRIPDVSVKVSRSMETVCIRDQSGEFEDIFMQGHDAAQFIQELDDLIEKAPDDLLFDDAVKSLAAPYCENIWN